MSRLIPILITALVIASPTVADRGPHGTGLRPDGGVAELMDRAEAFYRDGELVKARHCLERAQKLLDEELSQVGEPERPPLSNARQLLHYLRIYEVHAYGQDEELDEAHDFLVDHLLLIKAVEANDRALFAPRNLDFIIGIDGRVSRIEDFNVYHRIDGKISRLGPYNIYYGASGLPSQIGGIDYYFGAFSKRPSRVASVNLD